MAVQASCLHKVRNVGCEAKALPIRKRIRRCGVVSLRPDKLNTGENEDDAKTKDFGEFSHRVLRNFRRSISKPNALFQMKGFLRRNIAKSAGFAPLEPPYRRRARRGGMDPVRLDLNLAAPGWVKDMIFFSFPRSTLIPRYFS
jgi:hypothetical protein